MADHSTTGQGFRAAEQGVVDSIKPPSDGGNRRYSGDNLTEPHKALLDRQKAQRAVTNG